MQQSAPAERLPKNHSLIYEIVCEQAMGAHATPNAIFAEARRRRPGIGHSTVYRALGRLRDRGLILEVRVPGAASALYEPTRPGHAHFLCNRCGHVEDIDYALPLDVFDDVATNRGVDITAVSLTLHGLCVRCRALGRAECAL